ncbi:hypothetical protein M413DRAFT_297731 [Hebeloma cylindrosporum]|uniref:Uncharacterized protein n=1 Tax=Hebeloma cylindrosporum TaxID=76867 RepID=A0A0C3CPW9_HEBCY|nr:hypothetical protein M413DRAFT_297731 [Hebeloma cylindrosporum h7]
MTRHTSTPASCIHHTILCLLCIRCFTFLLSTSTRPPLIITPHTRTPLSSTLDVCSCPSLSSHFPTPFFLAHLCIPRLCVSCFFVPRLDVAGCKGRTFLRCTLYYLAILSFLQLFYTLMIIGKYTFCIFNITLAYRLPETTRAVAWEFASMVLAAYLCRG